MWFEKKQEMPRAMSNHVPVPSEYHRHVLEELINRAVIDLGLRSEFIKEFGDRTCGFGKSEGETILRWKLDRLAEQRVEDAEREKIKAIVMSLIKPSSLK